MAALDAAAVDPWQTIAALRRELEERTAERDEALAQQAATSEILGVISRSPTDTRPVFEAIVARAAALCEAEFSAVAKLEDGLLHLIAVHSLSPEETAAFHSLFPRSPERNFVMGRAFVEAQPVHFEDVLAKSDYDSRTIEVLQSVAGYRSFLGIPIFREGRPIGAIGCGRRQVKPFTATEIALIETFARQAAIALENARLLGELETRNRDLGEALEQQTATAEVLGVINSSPGNLGLVFETLLGTGARLCKAEQAVITLRNPQDGLYHHGASFGYGQDFKDLLIRNPVAPSRASLIGRTAFEGRVVHIEDAAADPEYNWPEALRLGRRRTGLGVPLLRGGTVVGTLALTRRRIERFTDKQIELIKTFADQAVIAIENARLLGELRESEERHGLVSKAVAEGIYEWDVEHNSLWVSSRLIEIFGFQGRNLTAADWNDLVHPEDFPKYRTALRDCFKSITARLDCEYRVRHSDGQYRWIEDRGVPVRNASGRAVRLVGAVSDISARKKADQALREALEQQIATAEVLQVINSSPGNLGPVFDAVLERATDLCGAAFGVLSVY
jgi:PAS domain S-box-containing protein